MKIGDSIKVKQGVFSPDYADLDIGDWQGRIVEIDNNIVTFELDSITLSQLSENYIIESLVEDFEWTLLSLELSEVEITQPQDSKDDVLQKQNKINSKYSCEEEEKRISEILDTQDAFVSETNLRKYYNYLKNNVQIFCVLTGMEDFDWEEPYIIGGWSKSEYEKKKLTKPSYTDHFILVEFIDKIDDWKGIIVKVKRISDEKMFDLPLWDLKIVDTDSSDYLLVSDYSSWMTNYQ
ncbi:MAG: hypothetical protein PF484_02555 [Bacteroidales bacterium]|jgi:hypothetical protein|nr:hypothetical protein [Bacteroidales bacterium]